MELTKLADSLQKRQLELGITDKDICKRLNIAEYKFNNKFKYDNFTVNFIANYAAVLDCEVMIYFKCKDDKDKNVIKTLIKRFFSRSPKDRQEKHH
jgi:hypothetical protein